MVRDTILAVILSFTISAALCPVGIPFLTRLKFGQQVRGDGPQSHLKKQGTPTMGGIMFLTALTITGLVFAGRYPKVIPVLFVTVGFGLIGFLDDFLKVVKKHSEGLNPKQKIAGQLLVSILFAVYVMKSDVGVGLLVPFTGGFENGIFLNAGILFVPLLIFVLLGTDNGVNFTDGLDGLCSSVTIIVAAFLTLASICHGRGISPVTGAVAGSLMGFLLFNAHPAQVFMGDTGSLALGGFVASAAYMMDMALFIPLFGLIYLAEVLSVIIQVSYFKKTKGKRIFRMAPIHHHFELGGWSETRVVAVFTVVTVLMCLVAWMAL